MVADTYSCQIFIVRHIHHIIHNFASRSKVCAGLKQPISHGRIFQPSDRPQCNMRRLRMNGNLAVLVFELYGLQLKHTIEIEDHAEMELQYGVVCKVRGVYVQQARTFSRSV